MFVCLGLSMASHISFDALDVAGQTCIDHSRDKLIPEAKKLDVGQSVAVPFYASDLCKPTGVELEANGARYYIRVDKLEDWSNGTFPIPLGGFSWKEYETASWYARLYRAFLLPFRRVLSEDWFRIVLRY